MPLTSPELADRARDVVARLSAAMEAGTSAARVQLICSELFVALRAESELPGIEPARSAILSTALDLCRRAGDPTIKTALRDAHLRAVIALLQGGLAAREASEAPRLRVIQGGLS
jgi:hypothetical protein